MEHARRKKKVKLMAQEKEKNQTVRPPGFKIGGASATPSPRVVLVLSCFSHEPNPYTNHNSFCLSSRLV
jgi:hypothetical protein